MFKLDNVLQLKENEEIRMVTKRHVVTVLPSLILAFLLIVVPFFFLFPLFSSGPTGIVVFLVLIIVGLVVALRTFVMWDGDVLIVSNLRVVKVTQTGIFSRTVNEIAAENISEASWEKKGIFGNVFNYGNLRIGALDKAKIRHIPRPQETHLLIQEIVDVVKNEQKEKGPDRKMRVKKIQDMIEGMEEDELRKIERLMKEESRTETVKSLFQSGDAKKDEEREITVKKLFGSNDESNKLKRLDE